MIVIHEAERLDGQGKVKGFVTKMWGQYHIIMENDENTAYLVKEESIRPVIDINNNIRGNEND